jgi:RNA-directed DNA polymerase
MTSALQAISKFSELAGLLEIDEKTLRRFSFGADQPVKRYSTDLFRKRDGTYRQLAIPHSTLKMIQRRLLVELEKLYYPNSRSFAYTKGRGIRDNAKAHIRRRIVFSIDLRDFFDQINFGRIRGRLIAAPYSLTNSVATTIAKLTTFQNKLPFGAPTSPILSNMICGGLDAELRRFGEENACYYTRYADDIVFSSQRSRFPSQVVRIIEEEGAREILPGVELDKIITAHGFEVNPSKTRLKTQHDSQIICGVVCNSKLNVRLALRREVRALLHAWQKFGRDKVQDLWVSKYGHSEEDHFESALRGKIEFIRHIRGDDDVVVWNIVDRFNALTTGRGINYQRPASLRDDWRAKIERSVCIVYAQSEGVSKEGAVSRQGSGFVIADGLILTNNHVACYPDGSAVENLTVKFSDIAIPIEVKVLRSSTSLDIALMHPRDPMWTNSMRPRAVDFDFGDIRQGKPITLAGYPNYRDGDSIHMASGHITGTSTLTALNSLEVFRISPNVIYGNSGGPVFNEEGRVLGVAVCGSGLSDAPYEIHNGAIPSSSMKDLIGRATT